MKKPHILVLDGDESVRIATERFLKSYGYDVTTASTNDEVIRLVTDGKRFDGAMLDGCLKTDLGRHERTFDTGAALLFLIEVGTPVILASSGDIDLCREMKGAGCTHSVEGDKINAHIRIMELVPITK